MQEILTINVKVTGIYEVKGKSGEAVIINFDGDCDSEYFKGIVLPGGVDTQKEVYPENRMISARYILEGTDSEGKKSRIFIENNAELGKDKKLDFTYPRIITDSECLSWMEKAELRGTIEPKERDCIIHIFRW